MTELPTPTIVADAFEPNRLAGLLSLLRIYSTPGFPPIRLRLEGTSPMKRDPEPWRMQLDVLQPDGKWTVMLFVTVPAQDGYGEAEADRQAALAIRLLAEARGEA